MKKIFTLFLVVGSLLGCASVPMESPENDAKARQFNNPVDTAGLYIYRNESIGGAIKMDVEIDGVPIGQTAANTFLYKEVSPGKHTIVSKTENDSTLEVDAEAGMLYYIWQEVKLGLLFARSKLQLMSKEEGQKGVNETKLAITK